MNIINDLDFQPEDITIVKKELEYKVENKEVLINNKTIELIINIANNVFMHIGKGFNECIYHKALLVDLYKTDYLIETEKIISILFKNVCVGYVKSDIVVEDNENMIIIELKALDREINYKEDIQINKYLKHINTYKKKVGLIINFSQKNNNCLKVQTKIID